MIPGAEVININYMHVRNPDESLVKHKAWINTIEKGIIIIAITKSWHGQQWNLVIINTSGCLYRIKVKM